MQNKIQHQALLQGSNLPLILLGIAMALYGMVSALMGSWLANQAMRGSITVSAYRNQLATFDRTAGLIAGTLLLLLFILCAARSTGSIRVAFLIGALSSAAPLLVGRAEHLLFNVIGLPTMSAGSVVAGAITTLLFALPMTIFFILLACAKRVLKWCRWLAVTSIFLVLGTAFFPIYVTILAFLLKPGDPAVGQMMEISSQVIKLRFILPGLSLFFLAFISYRFKQNQLSNTTAEYDRM
jgi:hypothetical protein